MSTLIQHKKHEIISVLNNLTAFSRNIDIIKARQVWDISKQGEGNVVAVIDTGVDKYHPNLTNNIIGGYNFTDDDNGDPNTFIDYKGHGTHVAGIISSYELLNGSKMVGVAPKSKLLILKVIDKNGIGSHENLIRAIQFGINWIGPNGEKVNAMNISLGSATPNEELHQSIKLARQKGVILVSSAGNHGDGNPDSFERSYPGYYKEVIQVGSITKEFKPSIFSNTNVNIDFVAPGENVYSTHLDGMFVKLTGTSMAAPYVTGAVSLILNLIDRSEPIMIPYLVYQYFLNHARKLDYSINQIGNGLIQLTS